MIEQIQDPPLHPKLAAILPPSEGNPYIFAREPIRSFLPTALQEEAHLEIPGNITMGRWVRCPAIVDTYYQTPLDTRQIGTKYSLSHQTVSLDIKAFIKGLHYHASLQTQNDFPLADLQHNLAKGKPPLEYQLLIQGGAGNRLIEMLEADKTKDQIRQELQMPPNQLNRRLRLLRALAMKASVDLSVPIQLSHQEILQLINDLKDQTRTDPQVQIALNLVSKMVLEIGQPLKKADKFLTSLVNLARQVGYHVYWRNIPLFVAAIRKAKIPMTDLPINKPEEGQKPTHNHHLIVTWHENRTIEAWSKESLLQTFLQHPVMVVCGPRVKPPSTWEIGQRKGVVAVAPIFAAVGIPNVHYRRYLTDECPVSIFAHKARGKERGDYTCYRGDEKKLKEFLESRVGKMIPANSPQI